MARALGISPSYVNLLENNERSVSVPVLLRLFEAYGVEWRDIAEEDGTTQLADLRVVLQDPLFAQTRPDLPQQRAALVHAPGLVQSFMTLYRSCQAWALLRRRPEPSRTPVKPTSEKPAPNRL